jgi:hypothetical protein
MPMTKPYAGIGDKYFLNKLVRMHGMTDNTTLFNISADISTPMSRQNAAIYHAVF